MKIRPKFERRATEFCRIYGYIAFSALAVGLALVIAYFTFGFEAFPVINASMVYILAVIAMFPVCVALMLVMHFGKYPQYEVQLRAGYNPVYLKSKWFNTPEEAYACAKHWEAKNIDNDAFVKEVWT